MALQSLQSLPENHLYDLLPAAVIEFDVRKLLEAVVGGVQDRQEDLRHFVKGFEVFLDPTKTFPEGEFNSINALLENPETGKQYNRSLIIDDETPLENAPNSELVAWVAERLNIDESLIISAQYASDTLRMVDENMLEFLAVTIGSTIWLTDKTTNDISRQRQIVESWFPRLKFKGTPQSFVTLGRLLGFDDVSYDPLWGRVAPHVTHDLGHPD